MFPRNKKGRPAAARWSREANVVQQKEEIANLVSIRRSLRAIGQGGMGEVWRAYHPGLKRDVAVKLLRPDRDPSLTQRFEREVQATIQLSHPTRSAFSTTGSPMTASRTM